jgi:hypothetical protein
LAAPRKRDGALGAGVGEEDDVVEFGGDTGDPFAAVRHELDAALSRSVPPLRRRRGAQFDVYTGVVLSVEFDQPIFIEDAVGRRTPVGDASSPSDLTGVLRLACGPNVLDSKPRDAHAHAHAHAELDSGAAALDFLVPLYGCRSAHGLCWLFSAAHSGVSDVAASAFPPRVLDSDELRRAAPRPNEFRALLLLDFVEAGRFHFLRRAEDLRGDGGSRALGDGCVVSLNSDGRRLVGFGGMPARGAFRVEASDGDGDGAVPAVAAAGADAHVLSAVGDDARATPAKDDHSLLQTTHSVTPSSSPHVLGVEHAAAAPQVHLFAPRTLPEGLASAYLQMETRLDESSPDFQDASWAERDRLSYFSFVQTLAALRTAEQVSAKQLDILAEPINAVAIPAAVSAAVSACKQTIVDAITPVLVPAITSPLAAPVVAAVAPAQPAAVFLEEGVEVHSGNGHARKRQRSHIAEALLSSAVDEDLLRRRVRAHLYVEPERFREAAAKHKARLRRAHRNEHPAFQREGAEGESLLQVGDNPVGESQFRNTALVGVSQAVSSDTSLQIFNSISLAAGDNLRHSTNRTVTRAATRVLVTSLTNSLTSGISARVANETSRTWTHNTTHRLTRPMLPLLTFAIAQTVSHAMSRRPQWDYFCYFCANHQPPAYCEYCHNSIYLHEALDHYVSYYASYYARYFDSFYGETFADKASQDFNNENPIYPTDARQPTAGQTQPYETYEDREDVSEAAEAMATRADSGQSTDEADGAASAPLERLRRQREARGATRALTQLQQQRNNAARSAVQRAPRFVSTSEAPGEGDGEGEGEGQAESDAVSPLPRREHVFPMQPGEVAARWRDVFASCDPERHLRLRLRAQLHVFSRRPARTSYSRSAFQVTAAGTLSLALLSSATGACHYAVRISVHRCDSDGANSETRVDACAAVFEPWLFAANVSTETPFTFAQTRDGRIAKFTVPTTPSSLRADAARQLARVARALTDLIAFDLDGVGAVRMRTVAAPRSVRARGESGGSSDSVIEAEAEAEAYNAGTADGDMLEAASVVGGSAIRQGTAVDLILLQRRTVSPTRARRRGTPHPLLDADAAVVFREGSRGPRVFMRRESLQSPEPLEGAAGGAALRDGALAFRASVEILAGPVDEHPIALATFHDHLRAHFALRDASAPPAIVDDDAAAADASTPWAVASAQGGLSWSLHRETDASAQLRMVARLIANDDILLSGPLAFGFRVSNDSAGVQFSVPHGLALPEASRNASLSEFARGGHECAAVHSWLLRPGNEFAATAHATATGGPGRAAMLSEALFPLALLGVRFQTTWRLALEGNATLFADACGDKAAARVSLRGRVIAEAGFAIGERASAQRPGACFACPRAFVAGAATRVALLAGEMDFAAALRGGDAVCLAGRARGRTLESRARLEGDGWQTELPRSLWARGGDSLADPAALAFANGLDCGTK